MWNRPFIGTMPMALRESKVYGVELDELSGRMAKALYPKAEITINGFGKYTLSDQFL